jgi:hypothetical protein
LAISRWKTRDNRIEHNNSALKILRLFFDFLFEFALFWSRSALEKGARLLTTYCCVEDSYWAAIQNTNLALDNFRLRKKEEKG